MNNFSDQKLLVIAPHSDDEVLGCGGLISKIKKSGGKVYVLIFNLGFEKLKSLYIATTMELSVTK